MEKSEFFKRFRRWNFCPALLYAAAGIAVICTEGAGIFPVAVACGVLFALAGIVNAVAFFFSYSENVASLLLGVCGIAVAVWLFVIRYVPLRVFGIALAVLVALFALSEVFGALECRKEGANRGIWIARIVLAAVFFGLGVVSAVSPFGSLLTLMTYSGAVLLAESLCSSLFTLLCGAFVPEEKLRFRPVK